VFRLAGRPRQCDPRVIPQKCRTGVQQGRRTHTGAHLGRRCGRAVQWHQELAPYPDGSANHRGSPLPCPDGASAARLRRATSRVGRLRSAGTPAVARRACSATRAVTTRGSGWLGAGGSAPTRYSSPNSWERWERAQQDRRNLDASQPHRSPTASCRRSWRPSSVATGGGWRRCWHARASTPRPVTRNGS
jgi:hypothetical protein